MGSPLSTSELRVACALPEKTNLNADDVCLLFSEAMQLQFPEMNIVQAEDADVRLVMSVATTQRISARIDWGDVQGEELGTARLGAPLDEIAVRAFFEQLIRTTPRP